MNHNRYHNRWIHVDRTQLKSHALRDLLHVLGPDFEAYAFEVEFKPAYRQQGEQKGKTQIELLYNGTLGFVGSSRWVHFLERVEGHTLAMLHRV